MALLNLFSIPKTNTANRRIVSLELSSAESGINIFKILRGNIIFGEAIKKLLIFFTSSAFRKKNIVINYVVIFILNKNNLILIQNNSKSN